MTNKKKSNPINILVSSQPELIKIPPQFLKRTPKRIILFLYFFTTLKKKATNLKNLKKKHKKINNKYIYFFLMVNTNAWNPNLKAPKVPPLMVNCFKCHKEFGVKWVIGHQAYSQKNNWAYWTDETEGDLKICDNCLINLRNNDKKLYWEKVKDVRKRERMSNYINQGSIRPS